MELFNSKTLKNFHEQYKMEQIDGREFLEKFAYGGPFCKSIRAEDVHFLRLSYHKANFFGSTDFYEKNTLDED